MSSGIEQHGAIQLNRPNGAQHQGGPPGGRMIPPPPPHHAAGPGAGGQRPAVINANQAQRQQAQQNMQMASRPNMQNMQNQMVMQNQQQQQQQYQQHQQALAQQQQSMIIPPQPPRNIIPPRLLEGPVVQISDIRKEPGRLTESEARDELTDVFVFRFELADRHDEYDSDGEKVRPTWAKVVRTEVKGISKKEASRQIKQLNVETKPLGEKKALMNGAQQRQLERTLEELEQRELDTRYHHVLAQVNQSLREKPRGTSRDRHRSTDRSRRGEKKHGSKKHGERHKRYSDNRSSRETIEYTDARGRHKSVVQGTRKRPVKETVSLTAYYKRCPKTDVDAVAMVLQRDAASARQLQPPYPQQTFAAQLPQHNQLAMQQRPQHPNQPGMNMNMNPQMGMGRGNGLGPQPGANNNKMPMMNPAPRMQMQIQMQGKPNNPMNRPGAVQVVNNQRQQIPNPFAPSSSQTSTTLSSDSESDSESESESESDSIVTPSSSHSSHSYVRRSSIHQQRRRGGRGSKYIESAPAHFGIPPRTVLPHQARRHEEHRISDEFIPLHNKNNNNNNNGSGSMNANPIRHTPIQPRQSLPPPPIPAPPPPLRQLQPHREPASLATTPHAPPYPLDLDELEAKAYAAGRADERADVRERAAVDVLRALPLPTQSFPRITPHPHQPPQLQLQHQHPGLLRRATLATPTIIHQTADDSRDDRLYDGPPARHPSSFPPRPPSPPRRPALSARRSSIRLVRPGEVSFAVDGREAAREREVLDSLGRFRIEEERRRGGVDMGMDRGRAVDMGMDRGRAVDRGYYDDDEEVVVLRERRGSRPGRRVVLGADALRRDVVYGGGVYDDDEEEEGGYIGHDGGGRQEERNPFTPRALSRPGMGERRATVGYLPRREYI